MTVRRDTLAQRKADMRRKHAEHAVVYRTQRLIASAWSTPELLVQADMEFGGLGSGLRRMVTLAEDDEQLRRWLCWRIVDMRWSVYKLDPEHPGEPEPGECPCGFCLYARARCLPPVPELAEQPELEAPVKRLTLADLRQEKA